MDRSPHKEGRRLAIGNDRRKEEGGRRKEEGGKKKSCERRGYDKITMDSIEG